MPEGGILTLAVRDEEPDLVGLEIRDSGSVLSDFAATHLFEAFVTTRPSGHLGWGAC